MSLPIKVVVSVNDLKLTRDGDNAVHGDQKADNSLDDNVGWKVTGKGLLCHTQKAAVLSGRKGSMKQRTDAQNEKNLVDHAGGG